MDDTKEMIFPGSPEAARYVKNIEGWVSRDGRFYGNGPDSEHVARYAGATHKRCTTCGAPVEANRALTICDACDLERQKDRYNARPRLKYGGEVPLYSEALGRFYNGLDYALDDVDDDEVEGVETLADLRLVICRPVYASGIDLDYYEIDLSDECDPPAELIDAIEEYNKAVAGILLSWKPGKFALDLSGEEQGENA